MELNAATDNLGMIELLCDITAEQPIEGEFTIPDYQPEIFKIVKAKAEPVVVQKLAVGSRATVDGYVKLTVIYQSDHDSRLYSLTQKLPFSKQTDLREPVGDTCLVLSDIKLSYLNCRAVNERRIDVRGAAALAVKVLSGSSADVISSVSGDGAQQRQKVVESVKQVAIAEKQFTLDEDLTFDTEGSESPVLLRADAKAYTETVSIESGRAVVSGSVNVTLAVDLSTSNQYRVKRSSFALPFNQVIDIDAVTDASRPVASASVLSIGADIEDSGLVGVSVLVGIEVRAYEDANATIVSDAYSTIYELELKQEQLYVTRSAASVKEAISLRQTVEKPSAGARLIDYFISPVGAVLASESGAVTAKISTVFSYILSDANGDVACWDKPFEFTVDVEDTFGAPYSSLQAIFLSLESSETDDAVTFKAEGYLTGTVLDVAKVTAVKSVDADTTKPKARPDMALAIYYAEEGEDVFEIAKAFSTSPVEIIQENNVHDGPLEKKSMLLIPIVE